MLLMVENKSEKRAAQRVFKKTVTAALANQGRFNIGHRGGSNNEVIYSNGPGTLWCAFGSSEDQKIPRTWNPLGIFDPDLPSQIITVEANIPTTSNSGRVAGLFARDPASGKVYLMHDGGIGGGKNGVGRSAFLAWAGARMTMVDVVRGDGSVRSGIVVGRVDSKDLPSRLWRFVQTVQDFKDAVAQGDLNDPAMHRAIKEWNDGFKPESSGQRSGSRRSGFDYITYHGDVVNLLYEERNGQRAADEHVTNNRLIDLYVLKDKSRTEVYEVKTSLDRQSIYTAIGQLITHSVDASPSVRRILVLPKGPLAADLERCIKSLSIDVRRFRITSGRKPEVVLL